MTRFHHFNFRLFSNRTFAIFLGLMLLFGSATGAWLSLEARDVFSDAVRQTDFPAGRSAPAVVLALPFLLSVFAVYIRRPAMLFPLAFWKGLFLSYVCFGILGAWGSGGWLICGCAMFCSICSMPVLWCYWLRHIGGGGPELRSFLTALGLLLAIGLTDRLVISPFLANILIF